MLLIWNTRSDANLEYSKLYSFFTPEVIITNAFRNFCLNPPAIPHNFQAMF